MSSISSLLTGTKNASSRIKRATMMSSSTSSLLSSTMTTKTMTSMMAKSIINNTASTRYIITPYTYSIASSSSSLSFFSSSKTSNYCSESQLRFFSSTSPITDDIDNKPLHYVVRSKRMTPTNGIETDLYDRAKRKNRSAPTRDLNYTADMWTKHKSPWRHLYSTTWIWYDSSFQRLLFPDLAIIAALSIGLSTITLQPDFFPGLTLTGSEFLNNLEGIENGFKGLTTKVGTLVALLLGYRVNNTYDRYCSARKMWCELENTSRDLARNVCMFIPTTTTTAATDISRNDTRTTSQGRTTTSSSSSSSSSNSDSNNVLLVRNKQLMLNLIRLYPIALHFFLTTKGSHHKLSRKGPNFQKQIYNEFHAECIDMWKQYDDGNDELLVHILDAFKDGKHVPLLILNMMGKCLADLSSLRSASSNISIIDNENSNDTSQIICNVINPVYIREMDHQIQRLSGGPFERILRTPMPTGFTRYASRVTTIWAYTVPFGLITDLGPYFNPVGSLLVVYCVMAIDDIGIQLEEPFNILPQRQYSDGIVDAVNLTETTFDD